MIVHALRSMDNIPYRTLQTWNIIGTCTFEPHEHWTSLVHALRLRLLLWDLDLDVLGFMLTFRFFLSIFFGSHEVWCRDCD